MDNKGQEGGEAARGSKGGKKPEEKIKREVTTSTPKVWQLGKDYQIYDPSDSLAFFHKDIGMSARRVLPFAWQLALVANDALNIASKELGVDGMFFVSYAAYYPNKVRAQNTNRVPVQKQYLLGPQLFFARFPQLGSERELWKNKSLEGKIHLSSLYWPHQRLSDEHPVLPIWCTRSHFSTDMRKRITPFPNPTSSGKSLLSAPQTPDTTTDVMGRTKGLYVELIQDQLLCASAQDYRERCWSGDGGCLRPAPGAGQQEWRDQQLLDQQNPIAEFVRAVGKACKDTPDEQITYRQARQWAPVAESLYTKDPAKTLITAEKHEKISLIDRFRRELPIETDATKRQGKNTKLTAEEEDLLKLMIAEGLTPAQILPYLPRSRNLSSIKNWTNKQRKMESAGQKQRGDEDEGQLDGGDDEA